MKKVVVVLVSIVLYVLLFYFLMPKHNHSAYYANKADVITTGWIPNILPESAYDIKVEYNTDSNESNGSFRYLEEDEVVFWNI
jgi:hypothetical protein